MSEIIFKTKNAYSIYKGFLDALYSLADKDEQQKAWIEGDYSNYTDFSEVYMRFSDFCESILSWSELSREQHQTLQDLYERVENFDRYLPGRKKTDKEICNDPQWHEIRKFAKAVYNDLKNVKLIP